MKGKSIIVLLFTVVALALMVWEIIHAFSLSNPKSGKAKPEKEKQVASIPDTGKSMRWKHYYFQNKTPVDAFFEKIISTYPVLDTLNPSDILPIKQFRVFEDTIAGKRICIFRPTSPDGKYGEWVILADSMKIQTKFNAVKIDTILVVSGDRKVIVFKKERTNAVLRDTIWL